MEAPTVENEEWERARSEHDLSFEQEHFTVAASKIQLVGDADILSASSGEVATRKTVEVSQQLRVALDEHEEVGLKGTAGDLRYSPQQTGRVAVRADEDAAKLLLELHTAAANPSKEHQALACSRGIGGGPLLAGRVSSSENDVSELLVHSESNIHGEDENEDQYDLMDQQKLDNEATRTRRQKHFSQSSSPGLSDENNVFKGCLKSLNRSVVSAARLPEIRYLVHKQNRSEHQTRRLLQLVQSAPAIKKAFAALPPRARLRALQPDLLVVETIADRSVAFRRLHSTSSEVPDDGGANVSLKVPCVDSACLLLRGTCSMLFIFHGTIRNVAQPLNVGESFDDETVSINRLPKYLVGQEPEEKLCLEVVADSVDGVEVMRISKSAVRIAFEQEQVRESQRCLARAAVVNRASSNQDGHGFAALLDYLRTSVVAFMPPLSSQLVDVVGSEAVLQFFSKGELIKKRPEKSEGLFVLLKGSALQLPRLGLLPRGVGLVEDEHAQLTIPDTELFPDDAIGELELCGVGYGEAWGFVDVVATTDCECLFFPAAIYAEHLLHIRKQLVLRRAALQEMLQRAEWYQAHRKWTPSVDRFSVVRRGVSPSLSRQASKNTDITSKEEQSHDSWSPLGPVDRFLRAGENPLLSLMSQLPLVVLQQLAARARIWRAKPGEVIFKEGEPANFLAIVLKGKVCAFHSATRPTWIAERSAQLLRSAASSIVSKHCLGNVLDIGTEIVQTNPRLETSSLPHQEGAATNVLDEAFLIEALVDAIMEGRNRRSHNIPAPDCGSRRLAFRRFVRIIGLESELDQVSSERRLFSCGTAESTIDGECLVDLNELGGPLGIVSEVGSGPYTLFSAGVVSGLDPALRPCSAIALGAEGADLLIFEGADISKTIQSMRRGLPNEEEVRKILARAGPDRTFSDIHLLDALLRSCEVEFAQLEYAASAQLCRCMRIFVVPPGELLCKEGDDLSGYGVVVGGHAVIMASEATRLSANEMPKLVEMPVDGLCVGVGFAFGNANLGTGYSWVDASCGALGRRKAATREGIARFSGEGWQIQRGIVRASDMSELQIAYLDHEHIFELMGHSMESAARQSALQLLRVASTAQPCSERSDKILDAILHQIKDLPSIRHLRMSEKVELAQLVEVISVEEGGDVMEACTKFVATTNCVSSPLHFGLVLRGCIGAYEDNELLSDCDSSVMRCELSLEQSIFPTSSIASHRSLRCSKKSRVTIPEIEALDGVAREREDDIELARKELQHLETAEQALRTRLDLEPLTATVEERLRIHSLRQKISKAREHVDMLVEKFGMVSFQPVRPTIVTSYFDPNSVGNRRVDRAGTLSLNFENEVESCISRQPSHKPSVGDDEDGPRLSCAASSSVLEDLVTDHSSTKSGSVFSSAPESFRNSGDVLTESMNLCICEYREGFVLSSSACEESTAKRESFVSRSLDSEILMKEGAEEQALEAGVTSPALQSEKDGVRYIAHAPTILLVLTQELFYSSLEAAALKTRLKRIAFLRKLFPIEVPDSLISELSVHFQRVRRPRGAVLVKEGSWAPALSVIAEGSCCCSVSATGTPVQALAAFSSSAGLAVRTLNGEAAPDASNGAGDSLGEAEAVPSALLFQEAASHSRGAGVGKVGLQHRQGFFPKSLFELGLLGEGHFVGVTTFVWRRPEEMTVVATSPVELLSLQVGSNPKLEKLLERCLEPLREALRCQVEFYRKHAINVASVPSKVAERKRRDHAKVRDACAALSGHPLAGAVSVDNSLSGGDSLSSLRYDPIRFAATEPRASRMPLPQGREFFYNLKLGTPKFQFRQFELRADSSTTVMADGAAAAVLAPSVIVERGAQASLSPQIPIVPLAPGNLRFQAQRSFDRRNKCDSRLMQESVCTMSPLQSLQESLMDSSSSLTSLKPNELGDNIFGSKLPTRGSIPTSEAVFKAKLLVDCMTSHSRPVSITSKLIEQQQESVNASRFHIPSQKSKQRAAKGAPRSEAMRRRHVIHPGTLSNAVSVPTSGGRKATQLKLPEPPTSLVPNSLTKPSGRQEPQQPIFPRSLWARCDDPPPPAPPSGPPPARHKGRILRTFGFSKPKPHRRREMLPQFSGTEQEQMELLAGKQARFPKFCHEDQHYRDVSSRIEAAPKPTTEGELCVRFEGERAIFVSDMSDFTRITREMGIVHFASLIMRMRQLLLPILANYNVRVVNTEADNFICVFDSAVEAVLAGIEAFHILTQYNANVPTGDLEVVISCICIDYGSNVLMDKRTKKLFGDAARNALNLGEHVAKTGDVVITDSVRQIIEKDTRCAELKYELCEEAGVRYYKLSGRLTNYSITFEQAQIGCDKLADGSAYGEFLDLLLNKRMGLGTDTTNFDRIFTGKYIRQSVVLMIGFDWAKVTEERGSEACITLMHDTIHFVHEIVNTYSAEIVREFHFIFQDSAVAVLAGLQVRRSIFEHNVNALPEKKFPLKCLASHSGALLMVPGTDVHWGDPVTTSSKLCEDSSVGKQEFFISSSVYETIKEDFRFGQLAYQQREFVVSNVTFLCVDVDDS